MAFANVYYLSAKTYPMDLYLIVLFFYLLAFMVGRTFLKSLVRD